MRNGDLKPATSIGANYRAAWGAIQTDVGILPKIIHWPVIPAKAGIQQEQIPPRSGQNEPLAASFEVRPNRDIAPLSRKILQNWIPAFAGMTQPCTDEPPETILPHQFESQRAACRAKSTADFIPKMGTVEEEADECMYWMELLGEAKLAQAEKLKPLIMEADELVAITVSSINTAKDQRK